MKKAIIIGASSGIGKELGIVLVENGYQVGLMARRIELLKTHQQKNPNQIYIGYLDITQTDDAILKMEDMIRMMGNQVDLIVINAGVGFLNQELDWGKGRRKILGFIS